jgi:phosphoserine aminotransferase
MARAINFNAGPAALPLSALERAQKELLDLAGTGMSVMEHSHRGKAYEAVHNEAISLVRELMGVPDSYDVLLLQGGASQQFAVVPMNLLPAGKSADYILTGSWSQKAYKEAKTLGTVRVAASTEKDKKFTRVPAQNELELDPNAAYVHITSNNTIFGSQWQDFPNTGNVPLIADMSSDIAWRPIDVSKFGLIYAGAQKNLGPSGLVVVIVKKELVASGRSDIPVIFQYRTHSENNSLYNTPPTFSV